MISLQHVKDIYCSCRLCKFTSVNELRWAANRDLAREFTKMPAFKPSKLRGPFFKLHRKS